MRKGSLGAAGGFVLAQRFALAADAIKVGLVDGANIAYHASSVGIGLLGDGFLAGGVSSETTQRLGREKHPAEAAETAPRR